ncbi:MAG TPA: glucans biosynthesis glucosyltransferase MdoH, partial [Rubrivivax sp.]|nr:glucans biosynthesis glucosyltransferase MdoH [Rubrivivax sp.]
AGLFTLLFGWVAAGFVTAVMGWRVLRRGDPHTRSYLAVADRPIADDASTAVGMPICNEHVPTVFAGLAATAESLVEAGGATLTEIYVLSDTSDPALRTTEWQAWLRLRDRFAASGLRVHYRWRLRRTRRKAGNVADFCRRWGARHRYMVVLDADSVMSGEAVLGLVRLMEAHPQAGIVQSAPVACGMDTLHARAQQFAGRVTGRLFSAGMQYWQLGESHYWGHNAIIRIAPFMAHCALAPLAGRGGLSGDILSHDFVEAALMRRAGWQVWMAADLPGSWEQPPPDLLAEMQRDRRWCQGNLQNARLIVEPGLHRVHRAMLGTGAMSYLSAPLWLGFVLLGLGLWFSGGHALPGDLLRPAMVGLWIATVGMLLLPRVLGVALVLRQKQQHLYGGGPKLVASALLEALLSSLQAPLRMAGHTVFVVAALTGLPLTWTSPPRQAHGLAWADTARPLLPLSLLAGLALAGALAVDQGMALWLAPMALPLLLALPLVVATGHPALGQALRRAGLLMTPEETAPPRTLRRAWAEAAESHPAPAPAVPGLVLALTRPLAAADQRVMRQLAPDGLDRRTATPAWR